MTFLDSKHTRAALVILVLGVALAIALAPFVTGLIGVPVLYVILQPVHDRLAKHVRPVPAAILVVVLALFLVLVPGVSFATLVITQAQEIASGVIQSPVLSGLSTLTIGDVNLGPQLASMGQQAATWVGSSAFSLVGTTLRVAINLLIALFGLYYLFLQPKNVWDGVLPYIPFSRVNADKLRRRFRDVTVSTIIGTGLSAAIQGTLVGLGLWALGFSNATFWGVIATALAVIPLVGTGLIWIPAAISLLLGHRTGAAILLTIWGLGIVGNVGYVIQPMVFKRFAQIHPIVTLVGALAGIPYFGILGLLIGPLALSYFFELLKMYREEYLETGTNKS